MDKLLERVPLPNGEIICDDEIKDFHIHNKQVETEENLDSLNKIYKDNYLNRMKQLKQIYA
jgi:hypothetical protein